MAIAVICWFAVDAPAIEASTNLGSLLAAPPSADWIEAPAAPSRLEGAFDAHSYGVYVGDAGSSEAALSRYGFVAGYGREWEQRGTQDYLVEGVFQFASSKGAKYWYDALKLDNQTTKEYKSSIPALASSTSFGVELDYSDGSREFRVEFIKGNLMFVVHMASSTNDLAATTLNQAQTEYDAAPQSLMDGVPSVNRSDNTLADMAGGVFIG